MMTVGAQLYTVREFCKTAEDFAQTLKKVADIGYTTVQVSGTCDYDPAWLRDELKKNGLSCVITHVKNDRLVNDTAALAREHTVFGCEYVGLGSFNFEKEDDFACEKFPAIYTPVAEALKANGKYFMYHNHAREYIRKDGSLIFDRLIDAMPAELMGFTFDTYWAQVGGADPAQWLEKLSGRIPCIHLKDCAYGQEMAVIGEGNINFDRVFAAAEKGGTRYMLVEQDYCNGEDPFDCLKRSYDYLVSRGFR